MRRSVHRSVTTITLLTAGMIAGACSNPTAPTASSATTPLKRGADDQGADDRGTGRHGRGKDDAAGHVRHGRGTDDGPNHT